MKLQEDVLFGSNELQTIKKIYNNSTKRKINYSNDNEKNLISSILTSLGITPRSSEVIYYCLLAASFGPETNSNPLLRYLKVLDNDIINNQTEKVGLVLDYIRTKKITVNGNEGAEDNVNLYLLNNTLYSMNEKDFIYTVQAIDSIINKKDKYFNLTPSGNIRVSIDLDKYTEFFRLKLRPQEEGPLDTEDEFDFDLDESLLQEAGDKKILEVPIGPKYLFQDFTYTKKSTILPAGIQGDPDRRTIWNYVEIWSNDVETDNISRRETDQRNQTRSSRQNKVRAAKEIINKQSIDDRIKQYLSSVMDELI